MRVALDARATGSHFPGIGRATLGLLGGLHELPQSFAVDVIANLDHPGREFRKSLAGDRRFRWHNTTPGPFDPAQQWQLPLLAHRLNAQVWHAPYYVRPLFGLPPTIVTVYDLIGQRVPAALPTARARVLFKLVVGISVRLATAVITTSRSAADDLMQLHHLPVDRLHVVPLAVDATFRPQSSAVIRAMRERLHLPERYVLYLGSNKPHKQPAMVVKAFGALLDRGRLPLDLALVMAGHWDQRFPEAMQAAAPYGDRIQFRHSIPEAELPALLGGALVFVFPSLYEGFGLPPLEAMACGAPVIASNRSSLPEVVGDAGVLVEPTVAGVAEALQALIDDSTLRAALRERGLKQAARFTWREVAEQTLKVYTIVGRRG